MKLTSSGLTHVGMKRSHNEDCLRIYRDENLFIVADGMGGHASGEVASEMSAETLAAFYRATSVDEELTWPYKYEYNQSYEENRIRVGVQLSNQRIHQSAVYDNKLKGMGTTMVAAAFYGNRCSIGHVGDSRVYLFRAGEMTQITEDHSLLNDYIKMRPGGMTPEEIEAFPHKNVIVRALGQKENVQVDVITQTMQEEDLLLLCSDGLSGMLTDPEMTLIISHHIKQANGVNHVDLHQLCADLIEGGNRNGGNDNITVLIVRCDQMSEAERTQESQQNLTPQWVKTQITPPKVEISSPSTIDREIDDILTDLESDDSVDPVFASEKLDFKTVKITPKSVPTPQSNHDQNVDADDEPSEIKNLSLPSLDTTEMDLDESQEHTVRMMPDDMESEE